MHESESIDESVCHLRVRCSGRCAGTCTGAGNHRSSGTVGGTSDNPGGDCANTGKGA
jgi:hypothetical protein